MQSREQISATLTGDVLEIGPGSYPFPTASGARVTFVDRSVEGGRDANWPELAGAPVGPQAQYDLNLDTDGLRPIPDGSFDAVIASHVIEHLASPLQVLREFERVLRPDGRLVLIVPDRRVSFDAVRDPTPFSHVLAEFRSVTTEVSEAHIREFCEAIYSQPPIHPPLVREWHDPQALDRERIELHRRRSIHVHCWAPDEFAALILGCLAHGLGAWRMVGHFAARDEFAFVLQRSASATPEEFLRDWTARAVQPVATDLQAAQAQIALLTAERDAARAQAAAAQREVRELRSSTSWRITAPLRALRRRLLSP